MFNNASVIHILGITGIMAAALLAVALSYTLRRLREQQTMNSKLKKSLDEMDEQAKLVVRTDIELNRTQEELDKKISGLYTLQRLSRAISTTLEESQVFKRIEAGYLEELGFEKALVFLWNDKEKKFLPHLNIGYSQEEAKTIKSFIDSQQDLFIELIRKEKVISSLSDIDNISKENINQIFKSISFVIAPVLPKEGSKGFFWVGTQNQDTFITEGDAELITILANQVGQALENSRLFEKTWKAQQELEIKVEERTHELSRALDELNLISKRKTDFVSSVSHELRTPLTSIKGYASILLTGKLGSIPSEVQERLEKINRHSDELVHMVNDLLDIARLESGRVTMKQEQQSLKNIVEQIVDLLSVQLKEKQLEISINIPSETKNVLVDRSQIERVFINIIGNAIKFTPPKGKISINVHKINKMVQVDIADTGYGIPQEAQEAIFEEFYRVDNPINQQLKGTGLGLSLVKHIIEAHKGKIWVNSKEGVGSTFSFTLPIS